MSLEDRLRAEDIYRVITKHADIVIREESRVDETRDQQEPKQRLVPCAIREMRILRFFRKGLPVRNSHASIIYLLKSQKGTCHD